MSRYTRSEGRNHDYMDIVSVLLAAVAGGTATDYEYDLLTVPNIATLYPSGTSSAVPSNSVRVNTVSLLATAALTGGNTNNFTLNFFQRRAGALLVNTSSATTITAGTRAFTPASMANIVAGSQLVFAGGTGATETVTVISVTSTTATAVFVNGHSGGYTITSAPVASIAFVSGTNLAAHTPTQIAGSTNPVTNTFQAGDVLTVQRVSNNVTGIAQPIMSVQVEWVPA